jgi:3-oxoadipate enol-lactonase
VSRRKKGLRELDRISRSTGQGIADRLSELSPVLSGILVDHAYGTVYSGAELSRKFREIATVAMLAAGGYTAELRIHLEASLRVGVDFSELVALAEHVSIYAGVPRMIEMSDLLREFGTDEQKECAGSFFPMPDHETVLVDTGGKKPPLVLLHSIGTSRWIFRSLLPVLSRSHRVLAYDLRGHGAASGASGPLTMDRWAEDLRTILDRLGIPSAHIGGLSMGASLALYFGERYPDRVLSLSLMGIPSPDPEKFLERAGEIEERGAESQVAPTLARWFSPLFLAGDPWEVRICRENLLRMYPEDWKGALHALALLPPLPAIGRLPFPVSFIAGERDQSVTSESVRAFSSRYSASRLYIIPDAPHQMSLETPEALCKILQESAVLSDRT